MDKADGLGTGVAVAGHVALFAALSIGLAASIPPRPVPPPSMEVEFVEAVPTQAAGEPATEAPSVAEAPETGTPEEAMPQPAPVADPLPKAPMPEPVVAPSPPPAPAPVPVRAKPPEPRPEPKPVKSAPIKRADPVKKVAPKTKPAPVKTAPVKATPVPKTPVRQTATAAKTKVSAVKTNTGAGAKTASRGPRLGKNFLAGLSDPVAAKSATASGGSGAAAKTAAPAISKNEMAGIVAAIKRQVQPCANRQVNPGPGANRISVRLQIRLNQDGSLAAAPKVVSSSGVDDENSRYAKRVADLAIAAYTGCAPMRGLPLDLYKTAKGGWNNVAIIYKLPA